MGYKKTRGAIEIKKKKKKRTAKNKTKPQTEDSFSHS